MKKPKVSVIITTYNRVGLLKRAYHSVISQTYKNIEIVIVDDCSNDGTIEYLKTLKNDKTTIIINNESKGVQYNRNAGVTKSTGKFVVGLDDDDYFHPKRIEVMLQAYKPKYSFIGTLIQLEHKKGKMKCKKIVTLDDILWRNEAFHWPLVLKERMIEVGLFDLNLTSSQDHDMWIRLIHQYGDAMIVQKPYYYLDIGGHKRITNTKNKKYGGAKKFIKKHENLMTSKQIEYHNFYLKKLKKESISFIYFLNTVPFKFWKADFTYLIRSILGIIK